MKATHSLVRFTTTAIVLLGFLLVAPPLHAAVQINSIDPDPACLGQQLDILGSFGSAPSRYFVQIRPASGGAPLVSFGSNQVSWTSTKLTLNLPSNAVAPGTYRLTVDTMGQSGFATLGGVAIGNCAPAGGGDDGSMNGDDSSGTDDTNQQSGGDVNIPEAVAGISYQGPGSDIGEMLTQGPDLEIEFAKVDAGSYVEAGSTVSVRVKVRNNGSKRAEFKIAIGDPSSDEVITQTGKMAVYPGRTNGATLHLHLPEWNDTTARTEYRAHTFRTFAYLRNPNLRPRATSPSRIDQIRTSGPWHDSNDSDNAHRIIIRVIEPAPEAAPTPAEPTVVVYKTGKVNLDELHVARPEEAGGDEPYLVLFRVRARLYDQTSITINSGSGPGVIPHNTCSGGVRLGKNWARRGDCIPLPASPFDQTFPDVAPFEVVGVVAALFEQDGTTTNHRGNMIQAAAQSLKQHLREDFASVAPDGTRGETLRMGDYSVPNCRKITKATLATWKRFIQHAGSAVGTAYRDEISNFGNPDEFLAVFSPAVIYVPCLGPAGVPDIASEIGGLTPPVQVVAPGNFTLIRRDNEAYPLIPHNFAYELAGWVGLQ